ncbi:anthrax toxin-like adenylyl cyclase domain-containing protein [Vibrio aquimaris]|uniref:Bifunctional hemolysin/adenylate cyclase n=1 Tax=Vibrio aquimaris TaxID=2587862 RepID=A0A5P9CP29_9VIBR|nr:anthrax toxin-like adenylyl cyclase domain-containing protein [Vibrio aquimaris]QFT27733.1 Bifunctional hemolysin/adenylate cyclase precursor [Vibrio aquimaris]
MINVSSGIDTRSIGRHDANFSQSSGAEKMAEAEIRELFSLHSVGMPVDHAKKLQSVAKEKNTVFGIRPVESMVRQLIIENYPTKGFKVKGKSSNWGPQAGFICEKQQLSKRESRRPEDIEKLNTAIQEGKKNGAYTVSDLRISRARISELVSELGLITTSGNGHKISIQAKSPSKADYSFQAIQGADGLYTIYEDAADKPIQVLSHPATNAPLTADYDLFFIAPPIEEHSQSGIDSRPNTAVTYSELPNDPLSYGDFYSREDKDMGNISPRVRDLVGSLNEVLGRGENLEMFHHSDDAGNPVSDMLDNFPATFYLPHPIDSMIDGNRYQYKEVTVISGSEEYKDFVRCIKDNGYHFTSNPKWDTPNRPVFEEAREKFEALRYR